MRKFLIAFIILALCQVAGARTVTVVTGQGVAASSCDSCTGTLLFGSHFENSDDVTTGTPCGCNTNADVTWDKTANVEYSTTQESDGTYSIHVTSAEATKTATIPVDFSATTGTVVFDFYWVAETDFYHFINFTYNAANRIFLYYDDPYGVTLNIDHGGVNWNPYLAGAANTWHKVVIKWDTATAHDGKYFSFKVGTNSATSDNSTAFAAAPTSLVIGYSSSATTQEFYIDNLKVYNTWTDD